MIFPVLLHPRPENDIVVQFMSAASSSTALFAHSHSVSDTPSGSSPLFILFAFWDNSGAGGADPLSGTSVNNSWPWEKRAGFLRDPSNANLGIAGGIWTAGGPGVQLENSDSTLTFSFDSSTTSKVSHLYQVYNPNGDPVWVDDIIVSSSGASTSQTVTTNPVQDTIKAVIGVVCAETSSINVLTRDTDTTRGSWSTMVSTSVGTGEAGLKMGSQYKIPTKATGVTEVSTQTFNTALGTSTDYIITAIVLGTEHRQVTHTALNVASRTVTDTSSGSITTLSVSATPVGGSGSLYNYQWVQTSGNPAITITTPTAASTTFSFNFTTGSCDTTVTGQFKCQAWQSKDSGSAYNESGTVDVSITWECATNYWTADIYDCTTCVYETTDTVNVFGDAFDLSVGSWYAANSGAKAVFIVEATTGPAAYTVDFDDPAISCATVNCIA